jgi:hypothetical protein
MWHGIFLGNGADALSPTLKIQESFMLAFIASGGPMEMAIFSKSGSLAGAHEVTIYFYTYNPAVKTAPLCSAGTR